MTWSNTLDRLREVLPWGRPHTSSIAVRSSPAEVELVGDARLVCPPISIYENDREYVVDADVPGASTDSIQISYDAGMIQLTAPVKGFPSVMFDVDTTQHALSWHRKLELPASVAGGNASASLRSGVLTMHIKKPKNKARQIAVSSG